MALVNPYSTFEAYQNAGGQLDEAKYLIASQKAAQTIYSRTNGLSEVHRNEMSAQLCACEIEIVDVTAGQSAMFSAGGSAVQGNIKASSHDGLSVTYGDLGEANRSYSSIIGSIIVMWLMSPVNLLLNWV